MLSTAVPQAPMSLRVSEMTKKLHGVPVAHGSQSCGQLRHVSLGSQTELGHRAPESPVPPSDTEAHDASSVSVGGELPSLDDIPADMAAAMVQVAEGGIGVIGEP